MNSKIALALLLILSIILFNLMHSEAQCNVCSAVSQMACVSETRYRFCVNNVPNGAISTCPTGYVCSTASPIICLPDSAGVAATCGDCNKCNLNMVFACTGVRTYALCLGTITPSTTVTSTCAANQVCDITSPQICVSSTTFTATCPTSGADTITTTTTVATPTTSATVPTYAQYFCSVMRINKRFQVPTDFDNSCRRYIYCFRTSAGTWSGQIYTCVGSTYFDPVSLYCVANRPSNC